MNKTISLDISLVDELTKIGLEINKELKEKHIQSLNIMASPGAGKTSVLMKTISHLKSLYRIGVIEGDIVPIDVEKIKALDIPVVLAHTGGACHLDSVMVRKALKLLPLDFLDLLFMENVGNLICPASFYIGTDLNIVIASVPEGDDKPAKYPTMFKSADIVLLNKKDLFDPDYFNLKYFKDTITSINPQCEVYEISARTGEGMDAWFAVLDTYLNSN